MTEIDRIRDIIDRHLPTIITGLQQVVYQNLHKDKDELTPDDIALRAALSSAHWIAKDIMTRNGKPLYDLPSVLDLLEMHKRDRARIAELEAESSDRFKDTPAHLEALDGVLGYLGRRLKNSDRKQEFVRGYAEARSDIAHIRGVIAYDWYRHEPEKAKLHNIDWDAINAMEHVGTNRIFPAPEKQKEA